MPVNSEGKGGLAEVCRRAEEGTWFGSCWRAARLGDGIKCNYMTEGCGFEAGEALPGQPAGPCGRAQRPAGGARVAAAMQAGLHGDKRSERASSCRSLTAAQGTREGSTGQLAVLCLQTPAPLDACAGTHPLPNTTCAPT